MKEKQTKFCIICSSLFIDKHNKGKKCCSINCANISTSITLKKNKTSVGINNPCYGKKGSLHPRYGKKNSKEHNEIISKTIKNYFSKIENRIKISNIVKNRIVKEETKQKISKWHKGRPMLSTRGKNHSNWQGGLSWETYQGTFTKAFKEIILQRDNYTCQLCFKNKSEIKRLCVHHIDYNKTNTTSWNCITLCQKCHIGTNLLDRWAWQNLLQDQMSDKYGYKYRYYKCPENDELEEIINNLKKEGKWFPKKYLESKSIKVS